MYFKGLICFLYVKLFNLGANLMGSDLYQNLQRYLERHLFTIREV